MNAPLTHLRPAVSDRPELLTDTRARNVADPTPDAQNIRDRVGRTTDSAATFAYGRGRLLYTLPMDPRWLRPHLLVHDQDGCYLADSDGNVIGMQGVVVHRMVGAEKVEDTRRL